MAMARYLFSNGAMYVINAYPIVSPKQNYNTSSIFVEFHSKIDCLESGEAHDSA